MNQITNVAAVSCGDEPTVKYHPTQSPVALWSFLSPFKFIFFYYQPAILLFWFTLIALISSETF